MTPLGILSTAVDSKHAKITRKDPTMEGNVMCIEDDVEIKVAHIKPGDRFFRSEAMAHKITAWHRSSLEPILKWLIRSQHQALPSQIIPLPTGTSCLKEAIRSISWRTESTRVSNLYGASRGGRQNQRPHLSKNGPFQADRTSSTYASLLLQAGAICKTWTIIF